ncbi:unnamed protein product [Triticum turgidum subsp. durum]|uniref:Uncharacterized protein n=1 Tax=Triticum turgidum subsp. durum TaxID=4567 RepID=A0A9R1PNX7_TRITD|nr:unnamed protein product [Triticum turgidum subsp. durum]
MPSTTPHAEVHREENIGLIEYLSSLLSFVWPARPLPSTPRGAPTVGATIHETRGGDKSEEVKANLNHLLLFQSASLLQLLTPATITARPTSLLPPTSVGHATAFCFRPLNWPPSWSLRVGARPHPTLHLPLLHPQTPPDSPWPIASTPTRQPPWGPK